jgi:bifunctional non-homologous end joining protein LigD
MAAAPDPLAKYRAKRNFDKTPEPAGTPGASSGLALAYVIQKHAASRLHYDFRLELDGVMLSWALPKGPSYDNKDKRMAVRVEDHPISYNTFEGTIPPKQYGAGTVIIWDRGTWEPVGDPAKGLAGGKLLFNLHGSKLAGLWELVRIGKPGDRQMAWILFKKKDAYERPKAAYDVVTALPDSVVAKPLPLIKAPPGAAAGGPRATTPTQLAKAVKAPFPAKLTPQLATLADGVPASGDWIYEIKLDGYRLMTRIDENGKVTLITRGGHDWTSKMPTLAKELGELGLKATWLDGEIVVMGPTGIPEFNALQHALDNKRASDPILYFLFDLPWFAGHDLRQVPLRERRQVLKDLIEASSAEHLRLSADFEADAASMLESARQLNLEGLIAKQADAPYVSARTETWLKLKCRQRQEFVIAGFADRNNDPRAAEVSALMLGVYDSSGALLYVGNVGAGWNSKTATELKKQLLTLEAKQSPFAETQDMKKSRWSKRPAGSERWVKPQLVAEVAFADWTPDGHIRHAKFEGLRADKPPQEVRRESSATLPGATPLRNSAPLVKLTHPERVIDASTGATKLALARYYDSVADWLLPHLKGRPCSLVRGPTGVDGELFYQKHVEKTRMPEVKELPAKLWPGHDALLEVPTATAIAAAVQMNTIEFHTWNALARRIAKPDRMVFDLDPGEGVPWTHVQEAATVLRAFLADLGLQSWLKTSGGKGLHVVVPLSPRHDWATVSGFTQALVQHVARVIPSRFVAKSGAQNRLGKIFIDYLRNGHGATTVAAFSARARPGLGVSMPIAWDALGPIKGGAQWTIANAREHLSFQAADPWADYWDAKQTLTQALKLLPTDVAAR